MSQPGEDEVLPCVQAIDEVDAHLHVVELRTKQQGGRQGDVPADGDVVAVGERLSRHDVDIFINGEGIRLASGT